MTRDWTSTDKADADDARRHREWWKRPDPFDPRNADEDDDAPMPGSPEAALTWVGWYFSASHRDPVRRELHGHSYEVKCWFEAGPDAVVLQEKLKVILTAFDHKTLPDELTRAEALATAIMHLMGCEGVEIFRPVERLGAKVGRCG